MESKLMQGTRELKIGDVVKTFRNEKRKIAGWRAPRTEASTGRVVLNFMNGKLDGEYYPSVVDAAIVEIKSKYVPPVTMQAVCKVINSQRGLTTGQTVCHVEYVALKGNLSQGAALPLIIANVARQHAVPTGNVEFKFWADTYMGTGGSPLYYGLDKNCKVVELGR